MIDDRERTKDTNDIWLIVIGSALQFCAWGANEADALRRAGHPVGARAVRSAWRHVPALCSPARAVGLGAVVVDDQFVDVAGVRYHLSDRGRTHPAATVEEPREPMEPDAEVLDESVLLGLVDQAARPFDLVERGTLKRIRFAPRKANAEDDEHASEVAHVVTRGKAGGVVRLAPKARAAQVPMDASVMPGRANG